MALCVQWPNRVEGNILAVSLRNDRELAVYNACSCLEHWGADPDPWPSTFGGALARSDRLFRTLVAYARNDPWNNITARGLLAV